MKGKSWIVLHWHQLTFNIRTNIEYRFCSNDKRCPYYFHAKKGIQINVSPSPPVIHLEKMNEKYFTPSPLDSMVNIAWSIFESNICDIGDSYETDETALLENTRGGYMWATSL